MKIFKMISVCICVMFAFSSCSIGDNENPKLDFETTEYIIKFDISNQTAHYIFVLTPENKVLAYYEDIHKKYEEISVDLVDLHIAHMDPYVENVLSLEPKEIEGYVNLTDFWQVKMYYNDMEAIFDYGASKSTDVNILLEQIIGCCDFKKTGNEKDLLLPVGSHNRKVFEDYANSK